MRPRSWVRSLAVLTAVATLTVACGGGDAQQQTQSPPAAGPRKGGTAVFGAEQWPQCLNPITSCSNASWLYYTVLQHVLPRAIELDPNGKFVASPLLTESPSLDNGGLTQNPFRVTFKINPRATWSDGSAITSADFDFTWRARMNTTGAVSTVGYDQIESITTTDPRTAVINFKQIYVDWPDLFGGAFDYVLQKASFPKADADKPNLGREMASSIPFSGGPWVLKSWNKQQAVFERNNNYWHDKALLDQVTMTPLEDQATEINALLSGQVAAIFPQPSNVSLHKQLQTNPNVRSRGGDGVYYEALWFNLDAPLVDDSKVREAVMYAVDREAVVDSIVKLNNPNAQVLNCGLVSFPHIGQWCSKTQPFSQFSYDPTKAAQILQGAGWVKGSDGIFQKDGEKLSIQFSTVAGNARRETTQALLKEKVRDAGIDLVIQNHDATVLFSNKLPKGQFVMAEYAQGGSPDPTITSILACDNIPTAKNAYAGQNYNRWCNKQASQLMEQSDQEIDEQKRLDLLSQVYDLQAREFISLPLYVLPNVSGWRIDKVAGPIGQYNSSIYGLFYNMHRWYRAG